MATVFERTFQNHTDLAEVVRAEKELFSDTLGRPSPYLVQFTSHEGHSYLCDLEGKVLDGLGIAWAVTNEPIPQDVIEAIESWEDGFGWQLVQPLKCSASTGRFDSSHQNQAATPRE